MFPPTGQGQPPTPTSPTPKATAPPPPSPEGNPELQKSLNPIELTLDEIGDWRSRIDASEKRVKNREGIWETLLKEYTPEVCEYGKAEDVKANAHFRNVHTKIGQLFVKSPEVILTPQGPALDQIPMLDPMTGMMRPMTAEEAVPVRQAVINKYMSREFIDGIALMDECLMDMQAWAGIACAEVSYSSVARTVNKPVMQPDPNFAPQAQPGSMLGLAPQVPPQVPVVDPMTGQPKTTPIQVPVFEKVDAARFSPKKLLFDDRLNSSRIEKDSRWIGRRFFIMKRLAKRKWGLSDADLEAATDGDDRVYKSKDDDGASSTVKDEIGGYVVWYKASYFTDNDHPEAIYQLILLDSVKDRTVVSRPSLDQTFDERGALTYDSLRGFPIKVGSLRDFPDSPFPMADSAFTNALAKQLNTSMQQGVLTRDAAIGLQFYDTDAIDDDDKTKMANAKPGEMIALKGGALLQGADKVLANTAQVHRTADDYRLEQQIQQRMDETLGISAVESGASPDTVRSATEINKTSAGAAGRQEKEQARVIAFYLDIVCAVDTLIFRYFTGDRYVSLVGEDGARKLAMWNKKLGSGYYSYDIKPNSQLSNDAARAGQQMLAAYVAVAPDPLTNRAVYLREIARNQGLDPTRVVYPPEVVAMQQAAQATGASSNPPYGANPSKPGPAGVEGSAHQQERSGGTQNANGPQQPGDNRQDRNPRPGGPK